MYPSDALVCQLISVICFVTIHRAIQVPLQQTRELHQHVPPGRERHVVCGRPGNGIRVDVHQQRGPRPAGTLYF